MSSQYQVLIMNNDVTINDEKIYMLNAYNEELKEKYFNEMYDGEIIDKLNGNDFWNDFEFKKLKFKCIYFNEGHIEPKNIDKLIVKIIDIFEKYLTENGTIIFDFNDLYNLKYKNKIHYSLLKKFNCIGYFILENVVPEYYLIYSKKDNIKQISLTNYDNIYNEIGGKNINDVISKEILGDSYKEDDLEPKLSTIRTNISKDKKDKIKEKSVIDFIKNRIIDYNKVSCTRDNNDDVICIFENDKTNEFKDYDVYTCVEENIDENNRYTLRYYIGTFSDERNKLLDFKNLNEFNNNKAYVCRKN